MTPLLVALLVALAAELNVWVLAWAMLVGLLDVGLVSAVGVAVWVRLGFGK
jgi:hypothetical protein